MRPETEGTGSIACSSLETSNAVRMFPCWIFSSIFPAFSSILSTMSVSLSTFLFFITVQSFSSPVSRF